MEVESDILSEVIECKDYHKKAPRFGERAWIAEGKGVDVVYWDTGNGWCDIMQVIPKSCEECRKKGVEFYRELRTALTRYYDENMCKVD